MPFDSKAQARFMFARHPAIAKRFAAETPDFARLPDRVGMAYGGDASEAAARMLAVKYNEHLRHPDAPEGTVCPNCGFALAGPYDEPDPAESLADALIASGRYE